MSLPRKIILEKAFRFFKFFSSFGRRGTVQDQEGPPPPQQQEGGPDAVAGEGRGGGGGGGAHVPGLPLRVQPGVAGEIYSELCTVYRIVFGTIVPLFFAWKGQMQGTTFKISNS